jgi:hypothetical protein
VVLGLYCTGVLYYLGLRTPRTSTGARTPVRVHAQLIKGVDLDSLARVPGRDSTRGSKGQKLATPVQV